MQQNQRKNRTIRMSVIKGEPVDGTGRICIHLFVQDEHGSFTEPHVLHPSLDENDTPIKQKVEARPTRGRLACDPERNPAPVTRGGVTTITSRTDDPQAVTCPACIASKDYTEIMAKLSRSTT